MKRLILSAATLAALTLPALAYEPIVSLPGEHLTVHPAGATDEILATTDQTDGKFGVVTLALKAGEGPGPAITHSLEAETWYVLEGTIEFHIGDRVFEGGPGTFVSVDAGQPHGFIPKTDGKLLVVFTPGDYEKFFVEWADKGLARGPELGALERAYGVTRPAP